MLAFTSTGWRRAGCTGRHINGWLRAKCSTESGKSFVLPNSLPGWLMILLGHWRERGRGWERHGEQNYFVEILGRLTGDATLEDGWRQIEARLKERFKAKFPLSLYIPTIFFTTGGVPFKKNLDLIMVFKCSQRTLISSFIVPENCGWKFTTTGVKLRVWKQLSGSRHCCSLKILPFVSLW